MLASSLHTGQLVDPRKVHSDRRCMPCPCLRSLKMRLASAALKLRTLLAPFKLELDLRKSCNDARAHRYTPVPPAPLRTQAGRVTDLQTVTLNRRCDSPSTSAEWETPSGRLKCHGRRPQARDEVKRLNSKPNQPVHQISAKGSVRPTPFAAQHLKG